MKLTKKILVPVCAVALSFTLFSFKSTSSNQDNLNVASVQFNSAEYSVGDYAQVARIRTVGKVAKKVWDRSGKEAAKFLAYEVVLRGVDWLLSAEEEIQAPQVASEINYKLSKL
ncbi:hypothetical protein [Tenacibaculum xiamenense]|uniref:hypothetical protein n=1 Tax=Tenacibaculum xiamenense TaxID=1261553 RepID=UPI0038964FCF